MAVRLRTAAGMLLLLHLSVPAISTGQTTVLELKSQPGDWVGGGIDQTFDTADGTFTASRDFSNGVAINFDGGPHWWYLHFAAPHNAELVPGVYLNATRWPFHSPTGAGLDVSGEGRGCNMLTGRFEVLEAVYSATGEVQRFAATFEQHCEDAVPALVGSILYNSTLAPPPPPPTICISDVATVAALADEVDMLETSIQTRNALKRALLAIQSAMDETHPRLARYLVVQFMSSAVQASSRRATSRHAISSTAADSLVCGASNVMTNIHIP